MDTKKLFKQLADEMASGIHYNFVERNDGMIQARRKREADTYLMNTATGEAWQIVNADGVFARWSLIDVEMAAIDERDRKALDTALSRSTRFGFGFYNYYKNGVACVSWRLQPDGCYYADSDGFGATDDDEVMFCAFINRRCDVLVPFQPMDNDLRERYRSMAEAMDRDSNNTPYLCLNRSLTVSWDKLADTESYADLLKRLTRMTMLRVYDGLANPTPRDDDDDDGADFLPDMSTIICGFNLNADPQRFIMSAIVCEPDEELPGVYGVSLYTTLIVSGHRIFSTRTPFGHLTAPELSAAMRNNNNVAVIADDIAATACALVKGKG